MKKNSIVSTISMEDTLSPGEGTSKDFEKEGSDVEVLSDQTGGDLGKLNYENLQKLSKGSTFEESKTCSTSLDSSSYPCPFPKCCLWWQTHTKENRAIIGYSDGTICFVGLTPNCPFISSTSVEKGMIEKLVICKDSSLEIISLMITTSTNEQWKLLLEQKTVGYYDDLVNMTKPGTSGRETKSSDVEHGKGNIDDWQIVIPLDEDKKQTENVASTTPSHPTPECAPVKEESIGIIPSIAKLAQYGSQKIGALKMQMRLKSLERATKMKFEPNNTALAVIDVPSQFPEILTTPSGPFFSVQNINNESLLAAMHSQSNTLLIHSMDIKLLPLNLYKLHNNCKNILLTKNLMYTIETLDQDENLDQGNQESLPPQPEATTSTTPTTQSYTTVSDLNDTNVVNVISCILASLKMEEECDFNEKSILSQFSFPPGERVISIHRRTVPITQEIENKMNGLELGPEVTARPHDKDDFYYIRDYSNYQSKLEEAENFDATDACVLSNKFPNILFESCYIVTNKTVYSVEFR